MSEIEIGEMGREEIAQAAAIHKSILSKERADRLKYDPEELFGKSIEKSPRTSLVARREGKVVGFIVGDIREWVFGVERAGWIETFGVEPQHMGGGVGKALGEALVARFREEGIEDIYTSVRWDSGDLISFFKSIGFDKSSFINLRLK